MKRIMTTLTAAVFALAAFALPAAAQQRCAARTDVVERLGSKYQESKQMDGLISEKQVFEIFADPDKGGWTLFATGQQEGIVCIIGAGQQFAFNENFEADAAEAQTTASASRDLTCLSPASMTTHMKDVRGQALLAEAVDAEGRPVAIYANAETGSWSILYASNPFMLCPLFTGESLETPREPAAPAGVEA